MVYFWTIVITHSFCHKKNDPAVKILANHRTIDGSRSVGTNSSPFKALAFDVGLKKAPGSSMAKWLESDLESLASRHCGFEYLQGLWILSCEEVFQLAYGMLLVLFGCPACAWNNAQWSTQGLPPPVKMESRHITYTVLVWCKTQLKKYLKSIREWLKVCFNLSS